MNEQDVKAFEDWVDPQYYDNVQRNAWQAACEYKDKQLAAKDVVISKKNEALDTISRVSIDPAIATCAKHALAIPNDDSALQEALQEALKQAKREGRAEMRERVAKWHDDTGWLLDEDDVPEAIRALPIEGENE